MGFIVLFLVTVMSSNFERAQSIKLAGLRGIELGDMSGYLIGTSIHSNESYAVFSDSELREKLNSAIPRIQKLTDTLQHGKSLTEFVFWGSDADALSSKQRDFWYSSQDFIQEM